MRTPSPIPKFIRDARHLAIRRCYESSDPNWIYYGGRGLEVDDVFLDPKTGPQAWYEELGDRTSSDLTVERIDNNLGYLVGNIAWIPQSENNKNRRPYGSATRMDFGEGFRGKSPLLTHKGEQRSIAEWAELLGLKTQTLRTRFRRGWSLDRCLSSTLYSPHNKPRKHQ